MTDPVAAVIRDMETHTGAGVSREKLLAVVEEEDLELAKKQGEVYVVSEDRIKSTVTEGMLDE